MVTVKGIEASMITADTHAELLIALGKEMKDKDGFSPEYVLIGETQAIIYHNEIKEAHAGTGRYCCECSNYDWGRGCKLKAGRIELKMDACENFNIYVSEV